MHALSFVISHSPSHGNGLTSTNHSLLTWHREPHVAASGRDPGLHIGLKFHVRGHIFFGEDNIDADLAPVFPDPSYSQRNAASLTGERRAWAA